VRVPNPGALASGDKGHRLVKLSYTQVVEHHGLDTDPSIDGRQIEQREVSGNIWVCDQR
jgi:hypothetical protein